MGSGGIPIIRLTLEGMKHSILHAFSEYESTLDQDLRAAVEAFCQPDNIKRVLAEEVRHTLAAVVREEVENYYRRGAGRRAVAEAVIKALGE